MFYSPLHGIVVGLVEGHYNIALDPVLLASMTYSWTNRLHITEERIIRSVGIESGDVASALELDIRCFWSSGGVVVMIAQRHRQSE